MADCWSNKSSRECESGRIELASLSASPLITNPNELYGRNETDDWLRAFWKDQEKDEGLTGWTDLSQASPKGHSGRSMLLPGIPEESEPDGNDGRGSKRNKVVVLGNGNGSVVTVNEELLKDLQTRFLCDNEQVDTNLEANKTDDSPTNENNEDFRKRRKLLANRVSSKKCRMKKIQLFADKEQLVKNLGDQIETMKLQIKVQQHNQMILKADNSLLKGKISALEEHSRLRALDNELKRDEVKRLKVQVECIQQQATDYHGAYANK